MNTQVATSVVDVEQILRNHKGTGIFEAALERISSNKELIRALGRYIDFNSVFGSGVANLAGEVGARQDLFRDVTEEIDLLSDRSVSVGAAIFLAAVDEFGDRALDCRSHHRALAQGTLKGALAYFNYEFMDSKDLLSRDESTAHSIALVCTGYGLNQEMDDGKLFRAIGFHIASELLADEEFRLLDRFLTIRYPDLVAYLGTSFGSAGGTQVPSYHWIRVHTTVEAEHCENAWRAAELACRYYVGPRALSDLRSWILGGFTDFANVQTEFMKGFGTIGKCGSVTCG